jgi:hypothetical protein
MGRGIYGMFRQKLLITVRFINKCRRKKRESVICPNLVREFSTCLLHYLAALFFSAIKKDSLSLNSFPLSIGEMGIIYFA